METTAFADGLGRRIPARGAEGERLESLRLCAEIAATPATQAALVERAARLSHFQHPSFARVRRIERVGGLAVGLAVVSDASEGVRLSDLLRQAERRLTDRSTAATLQLLQQAVSAVAALHGHASDASHGAIGPERLVVRPDGKVVVTEYVLAGALEALELSRSQLWSLFRVAVPPAAGTVRFDQQTDVFQLGVLALALALGRVLRRDEFPQRLADLLEEASAADTLCGYPGLSRPVRWWIGRALQFDARTAFRSAIEAKQSLETALSEEVAARSSTAAVQLLLANCSFSTLSPPAPSAEPRSPSGAVVAVGRAREGGAGAGSATERPLDRGSGAHRVARQALDADTGQVQVLADLSRAPSSPVQPRTNPPPPDLTEDEAAPEEAAPVRPWLARLPSLRAAFARSSRRLR